MSELREYIPLRKWDAWESLSRPERTLQAFAYLADVLRVREARSANRGEIIDAFHRDAGYALGNPWCAISITAVALACGYQKDELPNGPGAVRNWKAWGLRQGRIFGVPARGRVAFWLNTNGTGHLGLVVKSALGFVYTIEGNTSPGETGNQREGDGLYRRIRQRRKWQGFISLPE